MYLFSLLSMFAKYHYKLAGMIACSLIFASCGEGRVSVLSGVNQDSANEVVLILGNNNISVTQQVTKDGRYSIFVDANNKLAALNILHDNGLPHLGFTNMGEIFKKDSFISSPLEEHSRFLYALDQEISSMLSTLNGVVEVKTIVNLPMPNDNLWQSEQVPSSASVIIKYRQGERIDPYINRIKTLVSNAVPGLTTDRVTVVMLMQRSY